MREPWFNKELESLVKWKRAAFVKMRREGSIGAIESYKVARKDLKRERRAARRGHERSLVGRIRENPKAFYRYVRNKRMTSEGIGPIKDSNGKLRVEAEE
ncbi:hypothetical protein, partial [Proteus mirabilis]|uniref:hypothetical protein n=1 Tax=Proteus mirabilis TaxID=584 RepID=UPI0016274BAB